MAPWVPLTDAAVHLDFVNDRYYWDGQERSRSAFANFSLSGGCAMTPAGLAVDAVAANLAVDILLSSLNVTFPLALITSATPTNTSAQYVIAAIDGPTSVNFAINAVTTNRQTLVTTDNVSQAVVANAGVTGAARQTIGSNFETNNILQSVNGSTGGTADTSATLPTVDTLRVGERRGNLLPFLGTIHHVVIFAGAHTQTLLNTRTGLVHALQP